MWKKPKKAHDINSSEEAYSSALRLLEFRFRGEDELRAKLLEKGFTDMTVRDVLAKLREYKYVDDVRLLETLILQYKEIGLYGPVYIKQKLLQRKFPREQVEAAIREQYSSSAEAFVAKLFLAKQKHVDLSDQKQKQRLMQKFLRRGFTPDIVFRVVGNVISEE